MTRRDVENPWNLAAVCSEFIAWRQRTQLPTAEARRRADLIESYLRHLPADMPRPLKLGLAEHVDALAAEMKQAHLP